METEFTVILSGMRSLLTFAVALLCGTVIALVYWRVGTFKAMLGGSALGVLRSRFGSVQVIRSVLSARL